MSLPFCNVALPVPLRTTFTYAIPDALRDSVQPGSRVLVPFRNKSLVGVVVEHVQHAPPGTKIREIAKLMDFLPALTPKLIELGHWIAGYYLAPVGEVFRAMLPPVTELRTERQIVLTDAGRAAALQETTPRSLNPQQTAFLSQLVEKGGALPFASAAKLGLDDAALQRLRRAGLIEIRESMLGRKAKTQRVVAWKGVASAADEGAQPPAFDAKTDRVKATLEARGPLPLAQLLRVAQVSRSVIERMLREGLLEAWEERVDPAEDPFDAGYVPPAHELNAEQECALKLVRARFELGEFGVLLLHGVTGSGKTEVYMRAVQETLARGKTAIILVPEIALTLWIGRQCRAWFGARFEGVAVLHSALSDVERAREWWRVRNGEARVVVGTRSAIFAPLENLGLIIVDE
jgi:primosomal protein N' (replication factor Y)